MTQEEKDLLLKDLCARLSYDTWVQYEEKEWLVTGYGHGRVSLLPNVFSSAVGPCPLVEEVRPYLRPMSSMTEEELKEFTGFASISQHRFFIGDSYFWYNTYEEEDWLLAHHFDYRRLIEKGLALEAPEGMYKNEKDEDSAV